MTFVSVPQPTFGQQAQTKLLGLREIGCWEGACNARPCSPQPNEAPFLLFYLFEVCWLLIPQARFEQASTQLPNPRKTARVLRCGPHRAVAARGPCSCNPMHTAAEKATPRQKLRGLFLWKSVVSGGERRADSQNHNHRLPLCHSSAIPSSGFDANCASSARTATPRHPAVARCAAPPEAGGQPEP